MEDTTVQPQSNTQPNASMPPVPPINQSSGIANPEVGENVQPPMAPPLNPNSSMNNFDGPISLQNDVSMHAPSLLTQDGLSEQPAEMPASATSQQSDLPPITPLPTESDMTKFMSSRPDNMPSEQPLIAGEPSIAVSSLPPYTPPPSPPPPTTPPSGEVFLPPQPPIQSTPPFEVKPAHSSPKIFLVVGLILLIAGVVVGGLFFMRNRTSSEKVAVAPETSVTPTPPTQSFPITLSVDKPVEGEISTTGDIALQGKTTPHTVVVFFTDTDSDFVESDATGLFSANIKLVKGINSLTIDAVGSGGEEKIETRQIVYDTD